VRALDSDEAAYWVCAYAFLDSSSTQECVEREQSLI